MTVSIALFTRDLRVHDNPTLVAAARADRVAPLFVVDDDIRRSDYMSPNRARFLAESLADLDAGLRERGGRLIVRRGDVAHEVAKLAAEIDAETVHVSADVSHYAHAREDRLRERLESDGRELVVHDAVTTALAPGAVVPDNNDHFAVFTPYFRRWSTADRRTSVRAPSSLSVPQATGEGLPSGSDLGAGEPSPELMPGGETEGRRRLAAWLRGPVKRYEELHDDLAGDGTSRLSPYLHFGCLSATEIVEKVGTASEGAAAFVRQICWRDFHHQVLAARPESSWTDYRDRHKQWRTDADELAAWKDGRTGWPVIDAAMRQLRREGWMHNRARLLVGSYLTKTLRHDWREGARHFTDLLLDADIANNQMNWQWIAGTGTDTRPNRVLNPLIQAKRFDPDGDYVRRYVEELAGIEGAAIHRPWRLDAEAYARLDYPDRIGEVPGA